LHSFQKLSKDGDFVDEAYVIELIAVVGILIVFFLVLILGSGFGLGLGRVLHCGRGLLGCRPGSLFHDLLQPLVDNVVE